ncbi:MAG: hypothetical protein K9L86_06720 [Candidatus Omnitrophica bacterium]|nr:hypothetical protein [Candidatus Omnitrophota bacterium]
MVEKSNIIISISIGAFIIFLGSFIIAIRNKKQKRKGVNMKLQDFISETLSQIFHGIKNAQEKTKETGGEINPVYGFVGNTLKERKQQDYKLRYMEAIEFDVALTINENQNSSAEINATAKIYTVKAGGKATGSSEQNTGSIHRVKFSIPVTFPQSEISNNN